MRIVLSLALILFGGSQAAAINLIEALENVYLSDPGLGAARANLRGQNESVAVAISGFRPNLQINNSGEYRKVDNDVEDYSLNTLSTGLAVNQNLYQGGSTVADVRAAESDVESAQWQLVTTEQTTLLDAIQGYLAVQRDQEVVVFSEANESRLERQLQAAQDRFRFGEVTRTDVAQADARYAASIADRIRSEANLDISRSIFVDAIGLRPDNLQPPQIDELLSASPLPESLDEALTAVEDAPPLRAAVANERRARHVVDSQSGNLLPRFDVRAEVEHAREPNVAVDDRTDFAVNATFTIPLYQSGSEYAQIRRARRDLQRERLLIDDSRKSAVQSITESWRSLQAAKARLDSVKAQERAARIAVDGVREEALVGSRTVLDILDQEQELFQAQVSLARTLYEQHLATFQLLAAMGRLTAADLALDVDVYDPLTDFAYTRRQWIGTGLREER